MSSLTCKLLLCYRKRALYTIPREGAAKMQKLNGFTRVITMSMNEMTSGTVQISDAVQAVSEIRQKNKQRIESLSSEVGKFKV